MADEEKVTEIDFGGALEVLEGRGMIDAGLMGKAEKLETEKLKEEGKEEATADAAATKTPEEIAAEAKAAEEAKKTADEEAAAKAVNADEAIKEPEFTDEQKTFLGKVKDEQDAALKAAKDAADAEKARADAAEQKLAAKGAAQTKIVPLHDLYLVNDEAELRARELQLAEFESWALAHFDGTEAVEASADGKTPAQPAVSAEQIRMAYARVKREREAIVPSAREALRDFQARTESARVSVCGCLHGAAMTRPSSSALPLGRKPALRSWTTASLSPVRSTTTPFAKPACA